MTFFDGTHASGLSVRPELLADPTLLATSITGDPGDAVNALRLLALRDVATSGDPPVTFEAHLAETTAQIGAQVSAADARSGNLEVLGTSLQAERESLSGVDVNEELGLLLQFQRAFQASARIISAWDDTVQDLLQLLD
jgi:flagellar hook-associated protein 1 FlgK